MSNMFPLTLSKLSVRRRGKTVLGPIDLVIDQGGPTMVIGPNGSGKTTLLRVMHGIERISEGTAEWARTGSRKPRLCIPVPSRVAPHGC